MVNKFELRNEHGVLCFSLSQYQISYNELIIEKKQDLVIRLELYRIFDNGYEHILYERVPIYNAKINIINRCNTDMNGEYEVANQIFDFNLYLKFIDIYEVNSYNENNFREKLEQISICYGNRINDIYNPTKNEIEFQKILLSNGEEIQCTDLEYNIYLKDIATLKDNTTFSNLWMDKEFKGTVLLMVLNQLLIIFCMILPFKNIYILILFGLSIFYIKTFYIKLHYKIKSKYYFSPFINKSKLKKIFRQYYLSSEFIYIPFFVIAMSRVFTFSGALLIGYSTLTIIVLYIFEKQIENTNFLSINNEKLFFSKVGKGKIRRNYLVSYIQITQNLILLLLFSILK